MRMRSQNYLPRALSTLLVVFLLAGCVGTPTFLLPNSSVSASEATLFKIVMYMALVVFVLVEVLLIYNIIRYRRRSNQKPEEPRQKYGNFRLEVTWTAIPILLVLILFILTVRTIGATAAPAPQSGDVEVTVIGHQWWWEFDYPALGIKTANELHVPQGKNIYLTLQSADVIHSFWIPQLSHKVDVIPGQTNSQWFQANEAGTFYGQCAEFCGVNHANMRALVVVQSEADFNTWVTGQQQPVPTPASDLETQGFNMITKGVCSTCHSLGDNKAANPIGPDLTHLMSRSIFAGGMYELTPDNLQAWLRDPQAMKPGNLMVVKLSDSDIQALMSFLTKLK